MAMEELLEHIKKATGEDDVQILGLDDTFGFKCQQCGQCCMNRNDIILNPFDIFNGARYLGISCEEFIQKYTHMQLGGHSKIPMLLLKTSDNGFCPLLKLDIKDGGKFKCSIHVAKPGACANHPIGIARSINKETGEEETTYIKVGQCSNSVSDEQQVVREWVKASLEHEEEIQWAHTLQTRVTDFFDPRLFWLTTQALVQMVAEHEKVKGLDDNQPSLVPVLLELPKMYLSTTLGLVYGKYDITKPYIEQAKANLAELDDFYEHTKALYETLKAFEVNESHKTLADVVQESENSTQEEK